jgi:hypothetical protein
MDALTDHHRHIERLLARARTDRNAIAELADALSLHLAVEHEHLYPSLTIARPVLAELHAEHTEIRRVLVQLCWLDGDGELRDVAQCLLELEQLFEGHAAWQDRELLPSLRETLPGGRYADLTATVADGLAVAVALAA